MCPKIQISAKGIKSALKKYSPYQSIAEYVWNGFDAEASRIDISYTANELGAITQLSVNDNGYGIAHEKLQEKFEPLFESKKAALNKLTKNQSALHGKNGIGRLTFFTFASNAVWRTTYRKNEQVFTYDIFANADNINFYTGINARPRQTTEPTGTTVSFSGIFGLTQVQLGEKFQEYLCKEFAWFLALNRDRDFSLSLNGTPLDYSAYIAAQETFPLVHEKTGTTFTITYIQWKEKFNLETSKYYYLDCASKERWKENTTVKSKGKQFYHSVFIRSSYFDAFSFQIDQENSLQQPLLMGTRSDTQFRFLRKYLAKFLRIKRRPSLKTFGEKLVAEYAEQHIFSADTDSRVITLIQTIYEMQPRMFSGLNLDQKRLLTGTLSLIMQSAERISLLALLERLIDLGEEEKMELNSLLK